jgi:hypothetical protein
MDAFDVFEDQKRFNEITDAWIAGKITWKQLVKAEEYNFSLEELLYWESFNFWGKVKLILGFDKD